MNLPDVFREFDIRGEYPEKINHSFAFHLAKAIFNIYGPKKVLLANDLRLGSLDLKDSLIDGFSTNNIDLFDLCEVSISQFYYVMATGNYDFGIMVTASHLNDNHCGFKLAHNGGLPVDSQEIIKIRDVMSSLKDEAIIVPQYPISRVDFSEKYMAEILSKIKNQKLSMNFAVDLNNCSGSVVILSVLQKLGWNYDLVKDNRQGNPLLAENRKGIEKMMATGKYNLGVLFDSDGDRAIFVDSNGKLISPHFVLGLMGAKSSGNVAIDVRANLTTIDILKRFKKEFTIFPAWAQYIKFALKENPDFGFGGETSGHFIYPEFYFIDDGLLTFLKFVKLWEDLENRKLFYEFEKKYFELPETNFECDMEKAPAILQEIADGYRKQNVFVSIIDGVTVIGDNFKFNLRESVTENLLRLNIEAKDAKIAGKVIYDIKEWITNFATG